MSEEWADISTAPRDREIELRGVITLSAEHEKNTGVSSSKVWGIGRWMWEDCYSGILGSRPSQWREIQPLKPKAESAQ